MDYPTQRRPCFLITDLLVYFQVKRILANARKPQLPAEVPHQYDDKYLLAESLVRSAVLR